MAKNAPADWWPKNITEYGNAMLPTAQVPHRAKAHPGDSVMRRMSTVSSRGSASSVGTIEVATLAT